MADAAAPCVGRACRCKVHDKNAAAALAALLPVFLLELQAADPKSPAVWWVNTTRESEMRLVSLSLLFLTLIGFETGTGQDWAAADIATTRLKPASFTEVPGAIRAELERLGCTVPQPHGATRRANVIRGNFTSSRQVDWAALCSRERVSVILVFRGASTTDVVELPGKPDRDHLQTLSGGVIGFSRELAVASATFIREHHDRGDTPLPPLDHDGIDDRFIGKGSVVWYWTGGRWLQLAGSN